MKNSIINKTCQTKGISSKVAIACGSLLLAFTTMANEPTYTLDKNSKMQVITSIINELEQGYIFPSKAVKVGQKLRNRQQKNEYQDINDANVFAETLTEHLQLATGDKHLQVEFSDEIIPVSSDTKAQEARAAFEMEMWRAHNFGIEKIERIKFNMGYLKLTAFGPVNEVGPLLASAMNLLNNTDSLIIDLRGNFGGNEQTVQLLASYLLNQRTHLLDMVKREGNRTDQHWSSDYVEGKRFGEEKGVYVLIDKNSFSAAEDFSYTMKNLNRATLIGETSGGAANSGDTVRLNEHFNLFLPTARGISPITQTNWEGTGVTPDIKVLGEDALKKAQIVILTKLMASEQDPRRIERMKTRIAEL
jgi:C-terminal processing protease CtpA/Prc